MTAPAFAGTGAVRDAHRFDEERLAQWMAANVPGFAGPLRVEQFNGGQSNPTYKLVTPERRYVLRRKPPGTLLPGAHAVDREARVIRAVESTGFPVPHVHGLCTDDDVIGTWFYVMDMVDGRIFWNAALPDETPAGRAAIYDAMNATIAQLHRIDPAAIGLGDYGRSGKYIETTLVHGDFRIDNLIFAPDAFEVRAVLDWELSTLGHPLADFAYHLMMYRMPALTIPGLAGSDIAALGIPSEQDYVAAYCRRTGRAGIPDLDFYVAFNFFRFAAICHGIKARMVRGTAASPEAARLAADMPVLAALAWQQAERST
jgi:aminoglycoside phosphotransferase (APT) family kinase protein